LTIDQAPGPWTTPSSTARLSAALSAVRASSSSSALPWTVADPARRQRRGQGGGEGGSLFLAAIAVAMIRAGIMAFIAAAG